MTTATVRRHLGVGNKISGLLGYRRREENLGYFPAKQVTGKFRSRWTKVRLFFGLGEIERFASRLFAFEIRRQHGRAFGSVATPRLGYRGKINAVYTGNYTLHPSFTGMREDGSGNSIRRRKLPCEKSASVITRHCNFHRVTFNLFRTCKLQLKWRKSYVCLTWLRYLCAI